MTPFATLEDKKPRDLGARATEALARLAVGCAPSAHLMKSILVSLPRGFGWKHVDGTVHSTQEDASELVHKLLDAVPSLDTSLYANYSSVITCVSCGNTSTSTFTSAALMLDVSCSVADAVTD